MSESNNNYLGNPDRPVLVKESWAKRVQAATAATERDAAFYGETGRPAFALSRFYDMRPAMLKSSWTQNQAGAYTATAASLLIILFIFLYNRLVSDGERLKAFNRPFYPAD